ncbi:MAG: recombinase family protein [Rhodospirillum sp.]|nr:recombinase family protein [Rhodospirillum sp.]MCF8502886.1 recombinase family protein [Rhodospirillum sp.]
MLVALYARHSTDKQQGSAEDQINRCAAFCRQQGYRVVEAYRDEALSGAHMLNRPGIQALLTAAIDGDFERVITEDLSRISRDQADTATFFKKLTFIGVGIETVSEGIIGELHIGLKSTMNALYLKDLADKTRRGQIAAVLRGSIPGGVTYGYDIVRRFDENGEPIRGARSINEAEADVVKGIFSDYLAGVSLKKIVENLNSLGLPSPTGGKWGPTTLIGSAARETGLLRQTMYMGVITFNKMEFRKHPETGKRLSILRRRTEWIQAPAPELAILDERTFKAVQEMIIERSSKRSELILQRQRESDAEKTAREAERVNRWKRDQARPRKTIHTVLSGKLRCAKHGHGITAARERSYACPEPGCDLRQIARDDLLDQAMKALGKLTGAAISRHYETDEIRRRREAFTEEIEALAPQIEALREKVMTVLDAIGSAARTETIRGFLDAQEEEIRKLRWEQIKLERRRDALQPKPGMIKAVLRIYTQALAQLRADPEDRPATLILRRTIERFDVAGEREEPVVSVHFNIPGVMGLLDELDR